MESYIHHLQYLHRLNSHSQRHHDHRRHHFNPGKWRETKQQQSNQIQTLGQSTGSQVCPARWIRCTAHTAHTLTNTSIGQCIINAFDYYVECVLHILYAPYTHHDICLVYDTLHRCVCVFSHSSYCCKMPMLCVCANVNLAQLYAFVGAYVLDRCHSFDISNGNAFMIPQSKLIT